MDLKNRLTGFFQLVRFGIVGLIAALISYLILVYFVEVKHLKPITANIAAFFVAVQVSYWGHRCWTFNARDMLHRVALPRLIFVALSSFFANEVLFYIFLEFFEMPYQLAFCAVLLILPPITFLCNKFWVFR